MNHREERAELRGAVYRGDAGSFVGILKRDVWPENALQLIGDGLLRVLHAPTGGIDEAAHRCVGAPDFASSRPAGSAPHPSRVGMAGPLHRTSRWPGTDRQTAWRCQHPAGSGCPSRCS